MDATVASRRAVHRPRRKVAGVGFAGAGSTVIVWVLGAFGLAKDEHRPNAEAFLARHAHHLDAPIMTAFVVGLLTNELPDWSTDQWIVLAPQRRADRLKEKSPSLPAGLDAALQACAAERLFNERRGEEALPFARQALEELPGNEELMAWEANIVAGGATSIKLSRLFLGPDAWSNGAFLPVRSRVAGAGTKGPKWPSLNPPDAVRLEHASD